nr:histidine phosphatase family protein [Novosphingobium lindaniclasticum]
MATTLLLICIAATASSREGGFPGNGEPLDAAGAREAAGVSLPNRFRGDVHRGPSRAAAETATAMGLLAQEEIALADLSHGRWTGRSFAEIEAAEPGAMTRWLSDPSKGVPGGETMEQARLRVGAWMDRITARNDAVCAITHPMIVRAALAHALDMSLRSTLSIDVAPLSRTVLSFNRTWRLQSLGLAGESAGS